MALLYLLVYYSGGRGISCNQTPPPGAFLLREQEIGFQHLLSVDSKEEIDRFRQLLFHVYGQIVFSLFQ